jgi:glutamate carboxypeptidase
VGQFRLQVVGVAAHAGNDHARGRSAIRELAEKVLRIEAMTDYTRGVTLNVGTIQAGTKRNIVPDHAEAWVDVRYDDAERGEEIRKQLEQLAAEVFVDGTQTRLWGALHRPPKPASEDTLHLLQQYEDVARELGLATPASLHAGGGTDGSLMSAVGLPTLDSIGVRGGKAHTEGEFVVLGSLPERAAIAAILLRRLSGGPLASVPAADP